MRWPPTSETSPACSTPSPGSRSTRRYYRRAFAEAGVRVADLRTYDDVRRRVPRTAKTDLVANQRAHPPFGEFLAVPRSEFASLHTSPGPILIPRIASERGGTPVLKEAITAMGVRARRRRARHALVPHHARRAAAASRLRGGRLPGDQRRHRATAGSRSRSRRAWGATVYAGTPSFLANLGDTARGDGPRSAPRSRTTASASPPPRR